MMCAHVLQPINHTNEKSLVNIVDQLFEKIKKHYEKILSHTLNNIPVIMLFIVVVLASIYFLYALSKSELAPQEDQGIILAQTTAAANASLAQTQLYSKQVYQTFTNFPETSHVFQIDGFSGLNTSIAGVVFTPWDERKRTTMEIQPLLQNKLNNIAGAQDVAFQQPSLPGGGQGLPVQFVIKTTDSFDRLYDVANQVLHQAQTSGQFVFSDLDLKIDKSQTSVEINRDKAAQLGLNMESIAHVLTAALSQGYINYFNLAGRSYQVIPQTVRQDRLNKSVMLN